jgi:hypothetical protein
MRVAVTLQHETAIAAEPEAVWEALVDVDRWPEWNPTLSWADKPLVEGDWVKMVLHLGKRRMNMHQLMVTVDPPRILAWRSRNLLPGLMDVDRVFRIEMKADAGVVLVQTETAHGLAPVVMPFLRRKIVDGYVALGEALRRRLEQPSAPGAVGSGPDP